MSSSTPSKSRVLPMGMGGPTRRNTFFSLNRDKKTPTTPPIPNGTPVKQSSKDEASTISTKNPSASPKPAAASPPPKASTPETTSSSTPAKSKLAQIGGTLRRTPSQVSINLKRTPSTVSLAKKSDSAKGTGAPAAIKPPTSRSGSVSEAQPSETSSAANTATKSRLARMGGALRRNSSQTSLKLNQKSSVSSLRDAASSKTPATPSPKPATPQRKGSSTDSTASPPVAGKSRLAGLARIGGVLQRTTSKLTRSSSTASSASSVKDNNAAKEAAQLPPPAPQQETSATEPSASTLAPVPTAQEASPSSDVVTTAVEPASVVTQIITDVPQEPEASMPEPKPLSPVPEDPPQSMLDSTLVGGPGGFTDEPEDVAAPVVPSTVSVEEAAPAAAAVVVVPASTEAAKEDIPVEQPTAAQDTEWTVVPDATSAEVTPPVDEQKQDVVLPIQPSVVEESTAVDTNTAAEESGATAPATVVSPLEVNNDASTQLTEAESQPVDVVAPSVTTTDVELTQAAERKMMEAETKVHEGAMNSTPVPTAPAITNEVASTTPIPPITSSPSSSTPTTNGQPPFTHQHEIRSRALSVSVSGKGNATTGTSTSTSVAAKTEHRKGGSNNTGNGGWTVIASLYSLIFSSLETVRWALNRLRRG